MEKLLARVILSPCGAVLGNILLRPLLSLSVAEIIIPDVARTFQNPPDGAHIECSKTGHVIFRFTSLD